MRSWWLYLIECANGSLYTGIALDAEERYAAHVAGQGAKYTMMHPPVRLVGKIAFSDHRTAAQAEVAFKKLTKYQKQDRIPEFLRHGQGGDAEPPPIIEPELLRRLRDDR